MTYVLWARCVARLERTGTLGLILDSGLVGQTGFPRGNAGGGFWMLRVEEEIDDYRARVMHSGQEDSSQRPQWWVGSPVNHQSIGEAGKEYFPLNRFTGTGAGQGRQDEGDF